LKKKLLPTNTEISYTLFSPKRINSEATRSVAGLGYIRNHFPMKELKDISEGLLSHFASSNFYSDEQVRNIKRIYIQTAELLYKHDLLDEAVFKNLFMNWCKPDYHQTRSMFGYFYHSGEEQKNSIFENSKTLLTSRHSSPFLNMFKGVLDLKTLIVFFF
jgi:hypothetical protein